MADWINVGSVDEIPPGHHKTIDIHDVMVAVFNVDGKLYAIEDVCTHDGGILTGGDVQGHVVTCPRHGAQFDIRTGEVLAPPAYEPVATFPVRIHAGMIQTRDDRWD